MKSDQLRIAYIVGTKNCGSTLLDTLIGQAEGVRSLGEVGGFFRYVGQIDCDCGHRPVACEICATVIGDFRTSDVLLETLRLFPMVRRERRIYWTLVRTRARKRYAKLSDRLFSLVALRTGSGVLVDSTKNISRAAALAYDSQHDVRVLHLVRDGRGFLTSRRGRSPLEGLRYSAAASEFEWLVKNLLIWFLIRPRLDRAHYLLCRYEDLILDPITELARIEEFLGINLVGVAEKATTAGVRRDHFYEPKRAQDYSLVRLKTSKLTSQKATGLSNVLYWCTGGFLSSLWGYDYAQSYIKSDGEPG